MVPSSALLQKPETRISLVTCHEVLKGIDPDSDMDMDELECILMNLIGKVRTHEQRG